MPESRTTKKSLQTKKASQTKKRSTSRSKTKKPKVVLAKNKVVLFCALISGICVCALALSVFLNIEEKAQAKESSQTAQILQGQNSVQNSSAEKRHATEKQPPAVSTIVQEKKPVSPVRTQADTQNTTKKSESSPNVKFVTNEMKSSSVVKTIPQSQNSTAGVASSKSMGTQVASQNMNTSVKSEAKSTGTRNSQKNTQSSLASQNAQSSKNASTGAQTASQNTVKPATNSQIASAKTPVQEEKIQQNVPKNRFDIPPAANGATIVIIIDDAGRSAENTKKYTSLPFPITIAVLPKLPQTRACADVIRASGQEMILHQPMQSMNLNLDPGPGKITETMSGYEIAAIIKENLAELGPRVRGMNNHEGSLITSNVIKIGTVLDVCDEMGVYFLDSRTTAQTKAPQAALERDMHIFEKAGPYLDNDIDRAKMLERMRETLAYANRHGRAIVIGHVDKSVKILPDLLAEMYPEMKAAGYRFATPSMLK